jgi:hypothetical protein
MITARSPSEMTSSLVKKLTEAVLSNEVLESGMYIREDSARDNPDVPVLPPKMDQQAEPPSQPCLATTRMR